MDATFVAGHAIPVDWLDHSMPTATILELLANPYPSILSLEERVQRTILEGRSKPLARAWLVIGINHDQAAKLPTIRQKAGTWREGCSGLVG